MKKVINKKFSQKVLTIILILSTLFMMSAAFIDSTVCYAWMDKIEADLWEVMEQSSRSDLIPVYIFMRMVEDEAIDSIMLSERGLDSAVFADYERFHSEIVPMITRKVEWQFGYETAHHRESFDATSDQMSTSTNDANGASSEFERVGDSRSLVERAIVNAIDEYTMARREIVVREHSALNEAFIRRHVGRDREILHKSQSTSTIIVEATAAEIRAYARLNNVEVISLFVNSAPIEEMNLAPSQIGAGRGAGQTKSSAFNAGAGLFGDGVRIGVIEIGIFDRNSPQLSNIPTNRLLVHDAAGPNGGRVNASVSEHATVVTAAIVGQRLVVGGWVHEGIVPNATVVLTPLGSIDTIAHLYRAIHELAINQNVSIINLSLGWEQNTIAYTPIDREVDRLISSLSITLVKSAGNQGNGNGNVTSPGKALNAITVGNANTIQANGTMANTIPYNLNSSSSFQVPAFIPNKPDIVAPGTNIRIVRTTSGNGTFYGGNSGVSGTSMAAPITAGVAAQVIQANPILRNQPWAVKSILVVSARPERITTANNAIVTGSNNHLRQRSGAGFLDAANAVNIAVARRHGSYTLARNATQASSGSIHFTAGQRIRIAMTFERPDGIPVGNSFVQSDVLTLAIWCLSTGNIIVSETNTVQNVKILEFLVPRTGSYAVLVTAHRFSGVLIPIRYSHAWRVI